MAICTLKLLFYLFYFAFCYDSIYVKIIVLKYMKSLLRLTFFYFARN